MSLYQREICRKEFNYKTTFYNGGFLTYFKLYFEFIPTYRLALKAFPTYKKVWLWAGFFFKTFWWLLIKPIGVVYKRKRTLIGHVTTVNDEIDLKRTKVSKSNTHYLFGIPLLRHHWYILEKDWDYILEDR